jgi:hypothetical protein
MTLSLQGLPLRPESTLCSWYIAGHAGEGLEEMIARCKMGEHFLQQQALEENKDDFEHYFIYHVKEITSCTWQEAAHVICTKKPTRKPGSYVPFRFYLRRCVGVQIL